VCVRARGSACESDWEIVCECVCESDWESVRENAFEWLGGHP
jgi:hypothetical protein